MHMHLYPIITFLLLLENGAMPAKRTSRRSALEMFERRHKEKMHLREKELLIKEKEIDLQQRKLDIEEEASKKRWALEEAERTQKMEMERKERLAFIEILKNANTSRTT